jgi:hypothetical protein
MQLASLRDGREQNNATFSQPEPGTNAPLGWCPCPLDKYAASQVRRHPPPATRTAGARSAPLAFPAGRRARGVHTCLKTRHVSRACSPVRSFPTIRQTHMSHSTSASLSCVRSPMLRSFYCTLLPAPVSSGSALGERPAAIPCRISYLLSSI